MEESFRPMVFLGKTTSSSIGRRCWLGLLVLACWATSLPAPHAVRGQGISGIFLPEDRNDSRGIHRAQELIANGEFSQAIRFLDSVLAREEDSFVSGSDEEFAGLKETARLLLRDLPLEGRRIYEATYGPVSRRLLKEASSQGNMGQLREIAQRYFHTPAGHEAALLFAQHEADMGRHLTAALIYQQLLETPAAAERFQPQLSLLAAASWLAAENPLRAEAVLENMNGQGYRDIQVSGKDYPLRVSAVPDSMVDWLLRTVGAPEIKDPVAESQWLTPRGNAARNGHAEGGLPHLRVRWQVRLLEHHNLESIHEDMASLLTRQQQSRLPAATPLAVGDYIITRSAHGLVAIDFNTGKRVWQAQPQREALLQDLLDTNQRQNENEGGVEPAQEFARMIWEDYLYNTISSDGRRVYVIRDLSLPTWDRTRSLPFMPQQARQHGDADTNRLCAYDLPTQGKLVWEIDGKVRSGELQGAFFLGAPVAVGQSLYCLVEIKSETAIYLVALNRETGALEWRQQLADLEVGVGMDTRRRLQALMPSYDSGILVCPTGSGVVIGVDLAKQALAWAFRYEPESQPTLRSRMLKAQTLLNKEHWVHSDPLIVDGRVLLTQPESDHLNCLDLVTGKIQWKQPRGDALFLAGVDGETLLLVGNQQVSALRLADGKPAWTEAKLNLPEGAAPTGTGFFSQGKYFLPLSNSQVVAIDTSTGKIVDHTNSRDGQQLGNLICYRGAVISQSGRFLDCFEQVDVLRAKSEQRRNEDPTDFEALRTLGEIAYNEGKLPLAIELLSEAFDSAPEDLRTKEVLSEALVSALDEDFALYQDRLPLLAKIQQGSTQAQLTLLRLQSQGLLELGKADEAFSISLNAYDILVMNRDIEFSIGTDHTLKAQGWLAAQVALAWQAADSDQRKRIREQFATLVDRAKQAGAEEEWQSFYDCFGTLALADSVGLDLAVRSADQGDLIAGQQLLLKLAESGQPEIRNAAVAYNSRLLHEAGLPRLAASFDTNLRGELAEQECLPGLTGRECLAEWISSPANQPQWPYGQVEVKLREASVPRRKQISRHPRTGIPLERSDSVLGGCNVMLIGMVSSRNREIRILDSLGHEFYKAKLDQGTQAIINAQGSVYGVSRGNLLILSLGRQIVAFDTLSSSGEPLWRVNTTSSLQYLNRRRSNLRGRLGQRLTIRSQSDGNWIGIIGPVTADRCVFQVEERLVCVDSRTGEVLWEREHLPLGCDLYGDEQHVFAIPPDSRQARIFSTIDGRSLGESAANQPTWKERLATVGSQVVRWRVRADRRWELSALDTLTGEVQWEYDFEQNAHVDYEQNRFAAVVESTGRCVIVDLRTGERVVDQPIEKNVSLQKAYLLVGSDYFLVAAQQPSKVDRTRPVTSITQNRIDSTLSAFDGQLYSFDRGTGESNWSHPAEVQGLPLLLTQPVDLPIVAFVGNVRRRDKQGSRHELGMMLLEKSTGRELFRDETLPPTSHHCFFKVSDADPHDIVVEMLKRRVELKFTDHPRAPEPPAMYEAERKAGTGSRGLQKLGEKLFRGS